MKDFYVYVYLDQRKKGLWKFEALEFNYQPFYVGKGTGKRMKNHLLPSSLDRNTFTCSTIKSIMEEINELPLHYKIYENLTESEAFDLEENFIKHFGRRDLGTGILTNHTDGKEGQSGSKVPHPKAQKPIFQYSLQGKFIAKWDSLTEVGKNLKLKSIGNISTACKRKGTYSGFIWSYEDLGSKIDGQIKYKMPIKYNKVEKIDLITNEVIETFNSLNEAVEKCGFGKHASGKIASCALKKESMKSYKGYKWRIYD